MMATGVVSGFLNIGIVLLLAAGLIFAVRRLDRDDRDHAQGAGPSIEAEPRAKRALRRLEGRLIRLRHR
jgi:hypothetical protein